MSYKHLTQFERGSIEVLLVLGFSTRKIAERLNRHHSSIARELKRNTVEQGYSGQRASDLYSERKSTSSNYSKDSEDLAKNIESSFHATLSPEQIANTITKGVSLL